MTSMIKFKIRIGKSFLVAGPGFEPGTKAYETYMMPFQHPALCIVHDSDLLVNRGPIAIFETYMTSLCFDTL